MDYRKLKEELDALNKEAYEIGELLEQYIWAVAIGDGDPEKIQREMGLRSMALHKIEHRIFYTFRAGG